MTGLLKQKLEPDRLIQTILTVAAFVVLAGVVPVAIGKDGEPGTCLIACWWQVFTDARGTELADNAQGWITILMVLTGVCVLVSLACGWLAACLASAAKFVRGNCKARP